MEHDGGRGEEGEGKEWKKNRERGSIVSIAQQHSYSHDVIKRRGEGRRKGHMTHDVMERSGEGRRKRVP